MFYARLRTSRSFQKHKLHREGVPEFEQGGVAVKAKKEKMNFFPNAPSISLIFCEW